MGQTISHIIRTVTGGEAPRREAEDVLNTLIAVAEDKARIHHWKVAKHPEGAELLPVEKVVRKLHMLHCGVEREVGAVRGTVRHCLGAAVGEEVLDGLTAVAIRSLEKLVDVMDGSKSSEMASYAVLVGENGHIGRLDCYMFYYRFGCQTIANVAEDCLITSLVFSTVRTASIHPHNVGLLVQPPYSTPLPGEEPQDTLDRMRSIEKSLLKALDHQPRHRSAPKVLPSIEQVLTGIGSRAERKLPLR